MPETSSAAVVRPAKQRAKQSTMRSTKRPVEQLASQEMPSTQSTLPISVPVEAATTEAAETAAPETEAKPTDSAIDKAVFLRKYAENALQQAKQGSPEEYHKLVKLFAYSHRESPLTASAYAEAVSPWIPALSANVSALSISYRDLVSTVFNSDWLVNPDEQFVHRYATLVLQITSAHPAWVPQAIAALVRWFGYGARKCEVDEAPRVHNRVHSLVREIYRAIPTCGSSLVAALADCWPFRKAKVSMQVLFVRNSLRCLEYADSVSREVLRMVLNHIIQIDVEVQVELEDLESDGEDDDGDDGGDNNHGDDGVFQFDEVVGDSRPPGADTNAVVDSDAEHDDGSDSDSDAASDSESDTDFSSDSDSGSDIDPVLGGAGDPLKARNNARKIVAKLDALISTLLTWLERHAPTSPETDEQSEATSRLFLLFLDLFDAVVLPTFKSRYTQFVLFYLCAKDAQYADVFLGTMVGKVGEPVRNSVQDRVSRVSKVAAAAYLGSFVARAKHLQAPIVRSVVSVLVQWTNTYLDWYEHQQHEAEMAAGQQKVLLRKRTYAQTLGEAASVSRASGTVSPLLGQKQTLPQHQQQQSYAELERHGVFFAVTQAVLYMFCFRWRDMAEAAGGGPVIESELDNLRWCRELDGLQRVVFSRLNPLRACAPAVAQQFASVASQTSFMFCYAVLQQNRRSNRESFAAPGPISTVSAAAAAAAAGNTVQYGGANGDGDSKSIAGASSGQAMRARLDSFFPFDPMALPVSRQFIDSIYLEWQDVGEEPSDDDDGDVDYHAIPDLSTGGVNIPSAADGDGDRDGNEDKVIEQIVAMSISPVVSLAVIPGHRSG